MNERGAALQARMADLMAASLPRCSIPGCGRPTVGAEGKGLAACLCRLHLQHKARHGSAWAKTYLAADLKPYIKTAASWIDAHREEPWTAYALAALDGLLIGAGPVVPAQDLKHHRATFRARVAFARLREAGIKPQRILAVYLGGSALISDDRGSHRVEEFRIVQCAKALHRLASGTHRRWDFPMANGTTHPLEMHVYPRSSGMVLREIGGQVDEIARDLAEQAVPAIRQAKRETFGPHPSEAPGWVPPWRRALDKARAAP